MLRGFFTGIAFTLFAEFVLCMWALLTGGPTNERE